MSTIVTLTYDPEWRALAWAKNNCPSYITNKLHEFSNSDWKDPSKIDYYFGEASDATFFALRWISSCK